MPFFGDLFYDEPLPTKGFIDLPDRYVKQFDISDNTFINIKLLPIVAAVPRPVE